MDGWTHLCAAVSRASRVARGTQLSIQPNTSTYIYLSLRQVLHGLHRHEQAAVDWHTVGTLHSDPWLRRSALAEMARARARAHERAHGAPHGAAHGAAASPAALRPHTVGFHPTPPRSPDSSSVGSTVLRPRSPETATRPETRC
jgi:hypothetical protein